MKLRNLIDIVTSRWRNGTSCTGLASQIIAHPKDFVDALHGDVMASLFLTFYTNEFQLPDGDAAVGRQRVRICRPQIVFDLQGRDAEGYR